MPITANGIRHQIKETSDRVFLNAMSSLNFKRNKAVNDDQRQCQLSSGGNWMFFDFSRNNYGRSTATGSKTKSSDSGESDSVVTFLVQLLLICLMAIMTSGLFFLFNNLQKRDWTYHGLDTYIKRWNRGTQILQSVFEIASTVASGILFFFFSKGLVSLVVSVFVGGVVSFSAFSLPLLFLMAAFFVGSFGLGMLLGNMAVVSLIRWWSPLGTGRGFKRMHPKFLDQQSLL